MLESSIDMDGRPPDPDVVDRIILDEGHQAMTQGMNILLAEVMRRTPRRTGHLRRSMNKKVHMAGPHLIVGTVGTDVFYGVYLDQGTGLYGPRNAWIVPRHAKALRFPAGGGMGFAGPGFRLSGQPRSGAAGAAARWQFATRVRGIRPRFFMRDSALVTQAPIHGVFQQHAFQAARRVELAVRN